MGRTRPSTESRQRGGVTAESSLGRGFTRSRGRHVLFCLFNLETPARRSRERSRADFVAEERWRSHDPTSGRRRALPRRSRVPRLARSRSRKPSFPCRAETRHYWRSLRCRDRRRADPGRTVLAPAATGRREGSESDRILVTSRRSRRGVSRIRSHSGRQ